MLNIGDRAPEFTLPDHDGKDRSLTEMLNTGAILLYFYPTEFLLGGTRQACMLRDIHTEILRAGLKVVGISTRSVQSLARFQAKYKLPFTLLSDERKTVIRMYGATGPLGIGVRRITFLIDGGRMIRGTLLADLRIGRHEQFVRKAVMLRQASH